MAPLWVAALATGAKSFADNPVIGSPRSQARSACRPRQTRARHGWRRRERLAHMISAQDRAASTATASSSAAIFCRATHSRAARRRMAIGRGREMLQGDTITRRIAVDPEFLAAVRR